MNFIFTRSEINKREQNEDDFLAFELSPRIFDNQGKEISILLLSDGMGGHKYGEIVSKTVIKQARNYLSERIMDNFQNPNLEGKQFSFDNIDFKKIISESIIYCNDQILKLINNNKWKKAGATLVIVIVVDETYYWGYLGDSRLYHWNSDGGELNQITFDHSIVGIALKEGAITPKVAKYHSQKHQLVYFMGIEKVPSLEKVNYIGSGTLKKDDVLFLCSDGISGKPDNEQIENLFNLYLRASDGKDKHDIYAQIERKIAELAQALVDLSISLEETDNQTLMMFVAGGIESNITKKVDLKGDESFIQPGSEVEKVHAKRRNAISKPETNKLEDVNQPKKASPPNNMTPSKQDIPENAKKKLMSDSKVVIFLLGLFMSPAVYILTWRIFSNLGLNLTSEQYLSIVSLSIFGIVLIFWGLRSVTKLALS